MNKQDKVVLSAVVDQDFALSKEPSKVDPPEFANNPQLHLTRLRTKDSYEVKSGKRVLKGGRVT